MCFVRGERGAGIGTSGRGALEGRAVGRAVGRADGHGQLKVPQRPLARL
jgi:hypothetical protein